MLKKLNEFIEMRLLKTSHFLWNGVTLIILDINKNSIGNKELLFYEIRSV